ncbi:urease accessory protein [Jannaschia faecimaris]|uniref:Urease accessory protein UreD n=1 Tax=Jannaschia faecimaris TaxID=1244108 RepID=A0A1H3S182_9RHOB|nr:urease accessory protein UreD [Jannaschia faecimaris]SDZ31634.1 urease accessory protein [Jannaschia faecimaris]
MLDHPNMQRIRGEARVSLGRAGLRDLRQAGSAKAMLPRVDTDVPEVVFLNTAGGVTSGDRLDYTLNIGAGARATAGTQTAERAYRATGGPGRIETRITVSRGAHLDWLPQELIAFEGSHLARVTQVDLAADAHFLCVDSVILGRPAHGEIVTTARLDDLRTIRRDGALFHQEHLSLGPETLSDPVALGGVRALATLVLAAPGAGDALSAIRALPSTGGVRQAASAWDGRLVVRLMARDPAPLRRALMSAIVTLRGTPMPRVWQSDV